jgi:hypothetical protein
MFYDPTKLRWTTDIRIRLFVRDRDEDIDYEGITSDHGNIKSDHEDITGDHGIITGDHGVITGVLWEI